MSGKVSRKVWALLGAFGMVLTTGALAIPSASTAKVAAAAPTFLPNDPTKVPHYFGPYSNWANSPQVLADAIVTITPQPLDPGTGATATATVAPKTGAITAITVTSPGSGYLAPPAVTIAAPGVTITSAAAATAVISSGAISSIAVDQAGFGFTAPSVAITRQLLDTTGAGATATASGGVDSATLVSGGVYEIQPIVQFGLPIDPLGTRATGTATMVSLDPLATIPTFTISEITVVDPGSGYATAPVVNIFDGSLTVNAPTPAVVTTTIDIGKINITAGGSLYTLAPDVTITDAAILGVGGTGDGALATATVALAGAVTQINVTTQGAGYLTPGLKKFVDTLPGLGAPTGTPQTSSNYIPVAVADQATYPGSDYYMIGLVQYRHKFAAQLPATLLRGYVQLSATPTAFPLINANLDPSLSGLPYVQSHLPDGTVVWGTPVFLPDGTRAYGMDLPRYLGPTIVANKDVPVRVLFRNLLPNGAAGDLFLPTDTTLMGSGTGPDAFPMDGNGVNLPTQLDANGVPFPMAVDKGLVTDGVRNPMCNNTPKDPTCYSENRATLHLHGGVTPWISDGTPHQWTTPAGDASNYPKGVSVSNVPDMPAPGPGAETFFYTNQQSARLMFYHDHAWGITRLNVYAGEAAGYVVTDPMEQSLIGTGGALAGLGTGTPLIIQDKTFVPDNIAQTDPTWNAAAWGGTGSLWTPHVYMPAQNPGSPTGMSAFGRWMYGPWFWPPARDVVHPPIANPYYDASCDPATGQTAPIAPAVVGDPCEPQLIPATPNISVGMEAFNDTPIVNGTAYPTTTVNPTAYRYRILNAANDRFWNLSWYVADPRTGTLSEVALKPAEVAAAQTDPVVFPTPDTTWSPKGPSWVQIGTEGGFLPAPVIVPAHETTWIMDPTRFDVGNVDQHSLLLAPAERADVIVDFSQFRGKTLILYNDAPAAFPARVPGYDYYTGGPDLTPSGAPTTLPGYGPNTRTIMQVKVAVGTGTPVAFDKPNTTADRMGALVAAFTHHTALAGNTLGLPVGAPAGVFEASQDPIIVGQAAYNTAYGSNFAASGWCNSPTTPSAQCDGFARVQEQSFAPTPPDTTPMFKFKFDGLGTAPADPAVAKPRLAIPFEPKGMHDEMNSANFDEYGRMTANMGLEAPGATPLLQNIILFPYVNPPTERPLDSTGMPSSLKVTPISVETDGTQIWKITHNGVDTHPIHFHLYDVQILNRVTWDNIIIPPEPTELGWKDTVRVSPLEDTIVALRPIVPTLPFAVPDSVRPLNPSLPLGARGDVAGPLGTEAGFNNTDNLGDPIAAIVNVDYNFRWEYVFHCHILSHEEMDMMRPVVVEVNWSLPAAPTLAAPPRPGPVVLTWTDGTPVNYLQPSTWANPTVGAGGSNPQAEIGFHVWRAPVVAGVTGTFVDIGNTLANVGLTFTDTTLTFVPTTTYDYKVSARNVAGDTYSSTTRVAGIPTTTTAVTSSVNPSGVGQNVTFTATVTSTTAGVIARTVQFQDGGVNLGAPVALAGTPATASFSTTSLVGGAHSITAVYAGTSSFFTSTSAPLTQVVKLGSTTAVTSNRLPSGSPGQLVTFTATVTSTVGIPGGTVRFNVDGLNVGSALTLSALGTATYTTNTLVAGNHNVIAVYNGNLVYIGSTSTTFIQPIRLATTTAVTSSGSPSTFGNSVTFTARVTPTAATGTVQFTVDGANVGGPVALDLTGRATLTTTTLARGTRTIVGIHSGSASYGTSTGTRIQIVV